MPPVASSEYVYAWFTCADGSEGCGKESTGGEITIDACATCDCVGLLLSVMRIAKVKTPEVLGVPAITPVLAFRVMPAGNAPEETFQL